MNKSLKLMFLSQFINTPALKWVLLKHLRYVYCLQSPPHWQRAVQGNFAFKHLHRPLHPLIGLHPHWKSSLHAFAASGIVTHNGTQNNGII